MSLTAGRLRRQTRGPSSTPSSRPGAENELPSGPPWERVGDSKMTMKPVEELDDWLVRAEVRAFAEQQKDIENRAKCSACGEIGIWLVGDCPDGAGHPG